MVKRKTLEQFIKKANIIHKNKYDYSKFNYINNQTKGIIICSIHGEFLIRPNHHISGKMGCKECGLIRMKKNKTKTTEQFIKEAKKVHSNKYNYSLVRYKKNHIKIKIICSIHGEFLQRPISHLSGYGCKRCALEELSRQKLLSSEEFIQKVRKTHGYKYDYKLCEYKGSYKPIIIICNIHGKFSQIANDHLKGNGCPYCSNRKVCDENSLSSVCPDIAKEWNYSKNSSLSPDDIVFGSSLKVWWKCSKCSHNWETYICCRTKKGNGCPNCINRISKTSQKWLDKMEKIYGKIEREYPIKTIKRTYNVDGFSIKHNIIFSYHGSYWHGNPEIYNLNEYNSVAKKTFRELYLNTIIRSQYLKAEGYCLIEKWSD